MWYCKFQGDRIRVYTQRKEYGHYVLMQEPFCHVCSYPGVTTEECPWCYDYYGFNKIYAMGSYISSKTQRGREDMLSSHILGLKKYRNYKYPLGEALSLCIRHKWPELLESDLIVPVPKEESEYKIDRDTKNRYNQSLELSKELARKLDIPISEALEKTVPLSLLDLNRDQRRESVKGIYVIDSAAEVNGKSILLVDDVATSLSTSCECSKVLKNSGAAIVNVVVLGRNELID